MTKDILAWRAAVLADVPRLVEIAEAARAYLREQGVDQWQNGYPNAESFCRDIGNGVSYVLEREGVVVGTLCVSFAPDPTYSEIFEGAWLNDEPYAVIHRSAIAPELRGRGGAGALFGVAEQLCRERGVGNIRVDTHAENAPMRAVLVRQGFVQCGRILIPDAGDHDPNRVAYHKILE